MTLGCVQSSGTQSLSKTDERNGGSGEDDVDQLAQRHERDCGCAQPFRHLTDDGHAVSGELKPVRCRKPEDEDDERPRHPRQEPLPDEQHGQCTDRSGWGGGDAARDESSALPRCRLQ
jgi:hypothetical protein